MRRALEAAAVRVAPDMHTQAVANTLWALEAATVRMAPDMDEQQVQRSVSAMVVGTFRFKSDLRNHCAIVQPRLYDSAMVTQITLPRRRA